MRTTLFLFFLVLSLSVATPAAAQLRTEARTQPAEAKVYDEGAVQAAFNKVFSPEHFKMGHSYEMSYSAFGGEGASMGMYTNSMMWQFNSKLAARVDVSLAQPFGGDLYGDPNGGPRLLLRNAEIAYRPTENMMLHFSMQQSPYGGYLGPQGYGGAYGYRPYRGARAFNARVGTAPESLFWNDDLPR